MATPDSLERAAAEHSLVFKVKPIDTTQRCELRSLEATVTQLPNVIDVRTHPTRQVKVLSELKGFFGVRTLIIAGGLLPRPGVLLISNTIRTAMFARRRRSR